jgi:hypothetical protein
MATFKIDGVDHEIGDKECSDCWSGYPKPCKCGGFIHAKFGDENYDGDYWLYYSCDVCGEDYEELDEA